MKDMLRMTAAHVPDETALIMNSLPKSATGKILKRIVRDEYWKNKDR